jgi:hypothetical protein
MSETPESAAVNAPAEMREVQQSELCFGAVETQNEMQLEMRFETESTPAETPNEPPTGMRNETRVEIHTEAPAETPVELQPVEVQLVEPKNEARINLLAEAPIETQDQTPVVTQIETRVETQTEAPVELKSETRIEKQSETPIVTPAEARVETQTETRVEIERHEIKQFEIKNEKPAEPPAATRPEPQAVTLSDRPFRVKLRGSVLVLIRLPNKRQLRAALHQLSTTGGVINLEKPLDEKIEVELIFHIDRSTIRGKAQMLFPMWATQGWMQPFRFVELTDVDRNALQENLQSFIGNLAKGASASS